MPEIQRPPQALAVRVRVGYEQHAAAIAASARRLTGRSRSTLLTAVSIGAALVLPGWVGLATPPVGELARHLERARTVSAYLRADVSDEAAQRLNRALAGRADVAGSRYVTPTEGLTEFRRWSGLGSAVDALGRNPLPGALVIEPRAAATDSGAVERLVADLKARTEIAEVQSNDTWIRGYAAWVRALRGLATALGVLLCATALLTLGNTVRLQVDAAREEIDVLLRLGAEPAYVCRPFLYLGMGYGILGGTVAVALLTGLLLLVRPSVAALAAAIGSPLSVPLPGAGLCALLIGGGAVLGALTGALTAAPQVRALGGLDGPNG